MILIRLLLLYVVRSYAHDILNDGNSQSVNNIESIATLFNSSEPVFPDYTTGLKKRALRKGPYSGERQALPENATPVVQAIEILFCISVKVVYKSTMRAYHIKPNSITLTYTLIYSYQHSLYGHHQRIHHRLPAP